MFSKLKLENFKGFSSLDIDLLEKNTKRKPKKLVLIFGENGVGKSSIISAFQFLNKTATSLNHGIDFNNFLLSASKDKGLPEDVYNYLLKNEIGQYRASQYLDKYHKIGEDGNMVIHYEGFAGLSAPLFTYELTYTSASLIEEKLLFDDELVFYGAKGKDAYLNNKYIKSAAFVDLIKGNYSLYFGDYSLLSCIIYSLSNVNSDRKKEFIAKHFADFISAALTSDYYSPSDVDAADEHSYSSSSKLLPHITHGDYKDKDEEKKNNTIKALSKFFTSLYSNIIGVDYDIKIEGNGSKSYSLVFIEKTSGNKTMRIPYKLESTGTNNLLAIFTYLYAAVTKRDVVLIDEIDIGIHNELLKEVLFSVIGDLKTQLIISTHNAYLLNNSIKKYCYVMNRDQNQNITIYSLDSFNRMIQPKTDITGNYYKGKYGGIPSLRKLSMIDIVNAINHK